MLTEIWTGISVMERNRNMSTRWLTSKGIVSDAITADLEFIIDNLLALDPEQYSDERIINMIKLAKRVKRGVNE